RVGGMDRFSTAIWCRPWERPESDWVCRQESVAPREQGAAKNAVAPSTKTIGDSNPPPRTCTERARPTQNEDCSSAVICGLGAKRTFPLAVHPENEVASMTWSPDRVPWGMVTSRLWQNWYSPTPEGTQSA